MIDRMEETDLMPTAASPLPAARRVLVLAPHADDEVFGCGGSLRLLAEAGATITVIVASDGALGGSRDRPEADALIAEREAETRAAARELGYPAPAFWRLPDRGLRYGEALVGRVLEAMQSADADLVFAPALTELHADHQALALAAAEALRRLGGERSVAFYEVSAPLLPNTLIDITACEESKRAAMRCFRSQLSQQPYDERIAALNRYRSYTLGQGVRAAEAFFMAPAAELANGFAPLFESALGRRRRFGVAAEGADVPLVSVIVRSMERPTLPEALASVAVQTYSNIEVLVVNATGRPHSPVTDFDGRLVMRLIEAGTPLRRSRAANAGLDAASGRFLMFLDDDDLLLPDHIAKLTSALLRGAARAAYAGVRFVDPDGSTLQVFDEPWQPARLRGANYIPIHAVLFDRALVTEGCRFDEGLECFEDWDFWLQASRCTDFAHVPGVTAVYRHVPGDSGAFTAMSVEQHLARRADLLVKWREVFSVREWSETLHWFTQEREFALQHAAGLERHSAGLDQHIAGLGKHIEGLQEHIAGLEQAAHAREEHVAGLGQRNAGLEQRNAGLSQQNLQLQAELTSSRAQTIALLNSHSWKITAPLRWLRRLINR